VSDERDRLLAASVDYALEHGIGDLTLRQLASAIGTSHRMLVYYFGSRDELLVEVTKAVEAQQRASIDTDDLASMWRRLTDPAMWPQERLFFELYAQGLQGHEHAKAFLDGIVDDWLVPLTELAVEQGVPRAKARADARLQLAVTRGLLLDLLATGERKGVNAAMARFRELRG
jgi:AcrR family transcriptional regulator